jgi:hypothetical protein
VVAERGRGALVIRALFFVFVSCGVEPADGQFRCDDGRCPSGQSCGTDRICRVVPATGGDAATPDAGGASDGGSIDSARPDSGACTPEDDVDGDGFCPPLDCDDGDREISPEASESCSPNAEGFGRDENCDGRTDDGCPISFGTPHALVTAMPDLGHYFGAELDESGLRLYFARDYGSGGQPLYVATRPSLDSQFGRAVPIGGTPVDGVKFVSASITGDELEVFVQGATATSTVIYSASRGRRDDGFGTFNAVTSTTLDGGSYHPSVSRDGLELYFTAGLAEMRAIYRVRRSSRTSAFGAAVRVTDGQFPKLSHDGLLLFASGGRVFSRMSSSEEFAGYTTVDLPYGVLHYYDERTRELIFASLQPDITPFEYALTRVEVCRAATCDGAVPIVCETGERTSADRFHCYFQTGLESVDRDAARAQCAVREGARLATVHSPAENVEVNEVLPGGFIDLSNLVDSTRLAWSTGESYLWAAPGTPVTDFEPMSCATLDVAGDGSWDLVPCSSPGIAVCERTVWPNWLR